MAQRRIVFVEEYVLQDEHRFTDKRTVYRKGHRLGCSEATARHFIAKGVAELVARPAKKPAAGGAGDTDDGDTDGGDAEPDASAAARAGTGV